MPPVTIGYATSGGVQQLTSATADLAVPRESATLILLQLARTTLALKTRTFLAILLWLPPASALALALAWLVPSFLL